MEEDKLLNDTESMLRLKQKAKLIKDIFLIYESLSSKRQCCPKSSMRVAFRNITRDFKKGLKQIDKKFPVFIELPKLKKEGNGAYSEQRFDDKKDGPKEVKVSKWLGFRRKPPMIGDTNGEIVEEEPTGD